MEERIWREAIEAVVYELARHNGESPLDRGAALRRRVVALGASCGLATAFDRLAYERGWRMDENGFESASRVLALVYGVSTEAPTLVAA
jgi:hypothetical protein